MKNSPAQKNFYRDIYPSEPRKNWYGQVANAYNKTRPRYPHQIISRTVELAKLPPEANILELGCGPGTVTTDFAHRGFAMVCLEPSPEACHLARQNCSDYAKVQIVNTTFEEWQIETERFNAVLAATSFHWIAPEIRYLKSAQALKEHGSLILLWNIPMQPQEEVCQILQEVHQSQAVLVSPYQTRESHARDLSNLGKTMIESGLFENFISENVDYEITYTIDDYLSLLSTLSGYIALESQQRHALFTALKASLENQWGKSFQVSCFSCLHIAQKI